MPCCDPAAHGSWNNIDLPLLISEKCTELSRCIFLCRVLSYAAYNIMGTIMLKGLMNLKRAEHISDEQLMIRIGDGDRTAYKMLVDRHLRIFLAFAARVIQDRAEAEDIMQEAFIRVWKYAANWNPERGARFVTWFYRVVMNLSIDVKRKRKPTIELDEAFEIKANGPEPDESLSDKQMAAGLAAALEHLPQRQKIAITLCYFQGLGNREAAEILEITTGAIESLLVRGRKRMAELLKGQRKEFLKETMK